jgi:hypothetical protein
VSAKNLALGILIKHVSTQGQDKGLRDVLHTKTGFLTKKPRKSQSDSVDARSLKAREKALNERIQVVSSRVGRWSRHGVVEQMVNRMKTELEDIWQRQIKAANARRALEAALDLVRQARSAIAGFFKGQMYRRFILMGLKKEAGIALGLGKRIAAGRYTWRQWEFFESLRIEAGLAPDCCVIEG